MSLAGLKVELSNRTGRHLLPTFFSVDLLITITRELAIAFDRGMTKEELTDFAEVLRPYIRKLVAMQDEGWLTYYDANTDELFPKLCEQFYEYVRGELVSKLIEYDLPKSSLIERFGECFNLPKVE